MKTIALTVLHYGKPYLAAAIKSVIDHVDEHWILYSATPSHNGGRASLPCPDTEAQLRGIAEVVAGSKLHWVTGRWRFEHEQRNAIYDLCPDADRIFVVDSDEVWHPNTIHLVTNFLNGTLRDTKNILLPVMEYWRSFCKAMPTSLVWPVRVIHPKATGGQYQLNVHPINHFGYAQPVDYVRYKWSGIHGHQAELRPGWLDRVFIANAQEDCHPTNANFWYPETVDPWRHLPDFMQSHPFARLEVIP